MLHYEETGARPAVVLIHGFPLDRTMWRPQLAGLGKRARVIAPDLRGFGGSPDAPDTMQMTDYAADVKGLLDWLGVKHAVIGGLSMGGYVALAFAALYPQTVSALILANTRAGADTEAAREARHATAAKALDGGVAQIADAMLPKMLTATALAQRPALADEARAMMARQRPRGAAAALRGMASRPDRTGLLATFAAPALVIGSRDDAVIPPAESEAMARALPNARLVLIDGAHLSNMEEADAFNAAVEEFLAAV
jgi:pimeloyl-ACP methyl ester carboxylesterase